MQTPKSLACGVLASILLSLPAHADPPVVHHSITFTAVIVEPEDGGGPGKMTQIVTNGTILRAAISQNGDPTVKTSQLDLVEGENGGVIDIVRRTGGALFMRIGNPAEAVVTTSFSTENSKGKTMYRVLHNLLLHLPSDIEFDASDLNMTFITQLRTDSSFKSESVDFAGGPDTAAAFQYLIRGHIKTGARSYTYFDN